MTLSQLIGSLYTNNFDNINGLLDLWKANVHGIYIELERMYAFPEGGGWEQISIIKCITVACRSDSPSDKIEYGKEGRCL